MDKGWGLTLRDSESIGFFSNKPPTSGDLNYRHPTIRMFQGIEFPGKLGRTDHDDAAAPTPPDDNNRLAVNEVDFFSDNKRVLDDREDHQDSKPTNIVTTTTGVNKLEDKILAPPRPAFNIVNVSFFAHPIFFWIEFRV